MKLIVAVNNKGTIGRHGKLPWKCKADLQHFKQMTMGGCLIVGKATWEDSLKHLKLKGRKIYVVGQGYLTLGQAVRDAIKASDDLLDDVWVIGGASIYNQLAPLCDELHMSVINNNDDGDTYWSVPQNYRGVLFTYNFEEDADSTKEVGQASGDTIA